MQRHQAKQPGSLMSTYKLPEISGSVETDASGHAGHAEESLREMHLAEAVPATASNDSNSAPADAPSRAIILVAGLLPPPVDRRGESFFELVALMACSRSKLLRLSNFWFVRDGTERGSNRVSVVTD